jgi:hypothetical protein
VSWSAADCDHVEETLASDGFALIFGLFQAAEANLLRALRNAKSWEEALRIQGELDGIARLDPGRIRQNYPPKSEKP